MLSPHLTNMLDNRIVKFLNILQFQSVLFLKGDKLLTIDFEWFVNST
jgi:hypothetical protein